ncbi:unnamed protein product [Cylicocyclus nassatus]|uniref:Secreted protein n=1 Tax=Cylicocyclus nassatus TaxID=53992 RepID=A0AA36GSX6_CYLNA|nr:unnamed protein product [Cylicocyclus nassatus]
MRLTVLALLPMIAMLIHCSPLNDVPSGSSSSDSALSGYERVRLRAHRRRHRHKTSLNLEAEEMFGDHLHRSQHRTRKNKHALSSKRERNEDLCAMERRTIDLNTMGDEFDPPFLVEIRCQNTADYEKGHTDTLLEQTCVHNLLRCVQRYGEVHVSKRPAGSVHWSPHTLRNVPIGCDCMWPVDRSVLTTIERCKDLQLWLIKEKSDYLLRGLEVIGRQKEICDRTGIVEVDRRFEEALKRNEEVEVGGRAGICDRAVKVEFEKRRGEVST